jgi:hypothetical protein
MQATMYTRRYQSDLGGFVTLTGCTGLDRRATLGTAIRWLLLFPFPQVISILIRREEGSAVYVSNAMDHCCRMYKGGAMNTRLSTLNPPRIVPFAIDLLNRPPHP